MLVELIDFDTKNRISVLLFKSTYASIISLFSKSPPPLESSILNLRAASIASRTFDSKSDFPITKASITSNPFKSRAWKSFDSLRRSGASEGERVWMHQTVEIMVSGGKNGDPMSHWRPGSFLCGRRSFVHRTRTLVFSSIDSELPSETEEHFRFVVLFSKLICSYRFQLYTSDASSFWKSNTIFFFF